MVSPYFQTPANVKDFKLDSSYQQWSDWISKQHDNCIKYSGPKKGPEYEGIEDTYPEVKSQFYNATKTKVNDTDDVVISWNGFPLKMVTKYGRRTPESYINCEKAVVVNGKLRRTQDEYLEWYSTFDKDGNLLKVDFSCEGPEYWKRMYEWEPDTLLSLYKQYINPDVKLADLQRTVKDPKTGESVVKYNPFNKWNTDGIMHLNCRPNTLSAEIRLAAFATVPHGTKENPITEPVALCECANFGDSGRNSDPNIGAKVNAFCRQGFMVTCTNPVGLYIHSIDTSSWFVKGSRIPAEQIEKIVQYTRGDRASKHTLRVTVQVPAEFGYKLSDISIGGAPLKWGGQIAETITMALSGTAGKGPVTSAPYQGCVNSQRSEEKKEQTAAVKFTKPAKHRVSTR